jgi:hypothetical protein
MTRRSSFVIVDEAGDFVGSTVTAVIAIPPKTQRFVPVRPTVDDDRRLHPDSGSET